MREEAYKNITKSSITSWSESSSSEEDDFSDDDEFKIPKNMWIVKPGENSNRGNGIQVWPTLYEVNNIVRTCRPRQGILKVINKSYYIEKDTIDIATKVEDVQRQTFIVQKYIDRPLLINKRKFDIRAFGMMTSINGILKGYFYEDGYIRTSSKEYTTRSTNIFIHLTNDAVQKKSEDFGKFENGNKLSYHDFQKFLNTNHAGSNIWFYRDIMPQIKTLITDSFRSVYGKIDPFRRKNSFEIYGFDFMLDRDFKVYLIECNTNPCLELPCPLLARIIPSVLNDSFRIAIDPIYQPNDFSFSCKRTAALPTEIKYQLVFDEQIEVKILYIHNFIGTTSR